LIRKLKFGLILKIKCTSGGKNGVIGPDSMNGTIGDTHNHDSSTSALIIHDQIKQKIFYKENTIIPQTSTEKGMQHTVSSTVSHARSAVSLSTVSIYSN
jgi:hypothetical protein